MITHAEVARAEYIIDHSGIVNILMDGYRQDARGGKANPQELRLWLIGTLLATMHLRSATVQSAHRVLTEMIPIDVKLRLGVTERHEVDGAVTFEDISINAFYRWTSRLSDKLGWGEGQNPGLDEAERQRRHKVIFDAGCAVMDVFDLGWESTTLALDDTGVWSWGRGRRMVNPEDETAGRDSSTPEADGDDPGDHDSFTAAIAMIGDLEGEQLPPEITDEEAERLVDVYNARNEAEALKADSPSEQDPEVTAFEEVFLGKRKRVKHYRHDRDARWGVKTGKDGSRQSFFGHAVHTAVQTPGSGDPPDEPRLVIRFEVTPARTDIVAPSLRILDSLDRPIETVLADRLYNRSLPSRWWDELHDRSIWQVLDLRRDEQGFIEYQRVRWAAGWPHCPASPDHLGVIPRPAPTAPPEDFEAFGRQIDKREVYALARISPYKRDGATRYKCPALAGKVGCPLRPGTMQAAADLPLPIIEKPPDPNEEELPPCCSAGTVTLRPPENGRRLLQDDYWGSTKWTNAWNQRTYVEGVFGVWKSADGDNVHRGHHRLVGLALINLMATLAFAAYNARTLQQWFDRQRKVIDHPLNVLEQDRRHIMLFTDVEVAQALDGHPVAKDDPDEPAATGPEAA